MSFVAIAKLAAFAQNLYQAAGLEADKAASVARLQVLTDAMGRSTHGLSMLPLYLAELEKGTMTKAGAPTIVKDNAVSSVWDGGYLPGLWLVDEAIKTLIPKAKAYGLSAIAIRKSHHIGCLAALVKRATDAGLIAQIYNSDPAGQRVAPFGGKAALFTPNPMAIGYPSQPNAVLVDICASITTTSMTRQKFAAGENFEYEWLLDAQGAPTNNPAVLENTEPRGSLQLLGGQAAGHKGFGLALMIESLSQGLSGHGRLDAPKRWGGNVFVQVIDPAMFAGADEFAAQVDYFAAQCRSNPPIDNQKPVRLPGDQAAHNLSKAEKQGIELAAKTWSDIAPWAGKYGYGLPV